MLTGSIAEAYALIKIFDKKIFIKQEFCSLVRINRVIIKLNDGNKNPLG